MMAATSAMAQDGAGQAGAAKAQSGEPLAEVVVTGIRSSITTSRAIKRDSLEIVDPPDRVGRLPEIGRTMASTISSESRLIAREVLCWSGCR